MYNMLVQYWDKTLQFSQHAVLECPHAYTNLHPNSGHIHTIYLKYHETSLNSHGFHHWQTWGFEISAAPCVMPKFGTSLPSVVHHCCSAPRGTLLAWCPVQVTLP